MPTYYIHINVSIKVLLLSEVSFYIRSSWLCFWHLLLFLMFDICCLFHIPFWLLSIKDLSVHCFCVYVPLIQSSLVLSYDVLEMFSWQCLLSQWVISDDYGAEFGCTSWFSSLFPISWKKDQDMKKEAICIFLPSRVY